MARRGSSGRRKFVWARTAGVLNPTADPPAGNVDLLADVKGRFGGDVFVGSTVMAVRGYLAPYVAQTDALESTSATMRTGIRVCNQADIGDDLETQQAQAPYGVNAEANWMGWFPVRMSSSVVPASATWNHMASEFGVDLGSSRKMEELGQTLGMFFDWRAQDTADPPQFVVLDYDLSIGVKLP